jgi:NAD(P)-dependent dehydrogenase (short-subunit alcohol dehydrogenase family)
MIERGSGGTIINISSVAGLVGGHPDYMQTVGYNSSKGAIISMTRDLATSWAPYRQRYSPRLVPDPYERRPDREVRREDAPGHPPTPLRQPRRPQRGRDLPRLTGRRLRHRPDRRRGRRRDSLLAKIPHLGDVTDRGIWYKDLFAAQGSSKEVMP